MARMRRRGYMVRAGDVLPRAAVQWKHSWQALVGATLAEVTALVGITDDGTVRVIAGNEAAQREILAREHHLVAAWNVLATKLRARKAKRFSCWVNPGFEAPQLTRRRAPAARSEIAPDLPDEFLEEAAPVAREVGDPRLAEALIRARAAQLHRDSVAAVDEEGAT